MFISPDQVCNLKHSCLTVRSDNTAKIKFCFSKIGTKVISALSDSEYKRINDFLKEKSGERKKAIDFSAGAMVDAAEKKRAYSDLIPSWIYGDVSPNDVYEDLDEQTDRESFSSGKSSHLATMVHAASSTKSAVVYEELTDFESAEAVQNYLIATRAASRRKLQNQQPVATKGARKRSKPVPRDWMSLACDAVQSGIIECRTKSSEDETASSPRIASIVDQSKLTDQPLPFDIDLIHIPNPMDKHVLTADFECTISVELEFNADYKVVSMVVDLIT